MVALVPSDEAWDSWLSMLISRRSFCSRRHLSSVLAWRAGGCNELHGIGARGKIMGALRNVEGLLEVDRVRIRRAGNRYFADVSVGLARNVTFQKSGQVADEVTRAVNHVLPNTDVVVRSVPRPASAENIFDRVRAVATLHNLNVHDVSVQDLDGQLHVEQHLELDENMPLKQAHDQVSVLEAEIRTEIPEIKSILTHIESEPATIEAGEQIERDSQLEAKLKAVASNFPEILDMHDIEVKRVRDHVYFSCHCTFPDELPLSRVPDISTALNSLQAAGTGVVPRAYPP